MRSARQRLQFAATVARVRAFAEPLETGMQDPGQRASGSSWDSDTMASRLFLYCLLWVAAMCPPWTHASIALADPLRPAARRGGAVPDQVCVVRTGKFQRAARLARRQAGRCAAGAAPKLRRAAKEERVGATMPPRRPHGRRRHRRRRLAPVLRAGVPAVPDPRPQRRPGRRHHRLLRAAAARQPAVWRALPVSGARGARRPAVPRRAQLAGRRRRGRRWSASTGAT